MMLNITKIKLFHKVG